MRYADVTQPPPRDMSVSARPMMGARFGLRLTRRVAVPIPAKRAEAPGPRLRHRLLRVPVAAGRQSNDPAFYT